MKNMVAFFWAAALSSVAFADTPSYTFDQTTDIGSYEYHDPNFSKLTDGIVGNAGWALNEGVEWVGWRNKPVVNIDFDFGSAKLISFISIGSTQDRLDDVALPSFEIYTLEGGNWVSKGSIINPPSSANDHSSVDSSEHQFYSYSFSTPITNQYIRVAAKANGPWIFVDEVSFRAATPVPEPESYAMLIAGLGLMGAVARRRKNKD